jgi:alpha-ketoglutarate-dependent taurine dioxygenase
VEIEPLNRAIGARVSGLQLRADLSDAERDVLLAALLKHHVLFFEGHDLNPALQRAVAARFGPRTPEEKVRWEKGAQRPFAPPAPGGAHAPDHWPAGPVRQRRLHDAHRGTASDGE